MKRRSYIILAALLTASLSSGAIEVTSFQMRGETSFSDNADFVSVTFSNARELGFSDAPLDSGKYSSQEVVGFAGTSAAGITSVGFYLHGPEIEGWLDFDVNTGSVLESGVRILINYPDQIISDPYLLEHSLYYDAMTGHGMVVWANAKPVGDNSATLPMLAVCAGLVLWRGRSLGMDPKT